MSVNAVYHVEGDAELVGDDVAGLGVFDFVDVEVAFCGWVDAAAWVADEAGAVASGALGDAGGPGV